MNLLKTEFFQMMLGAAIAIFFVYSIGRLMNEAVLPWLFM
jgi:hypothetical protein